ncbi:hypothetical protein [Haladaptatus sp. NG-SE-30]
MGSVGFTPAVNGGILSSKKDSHDDLAVTLPAPDDLIDTTTISNIDCIVSEYELPQTELTGLDILTAVRENYQSMPYFSMRRIESDRQTPNPS